MGAPTPIWVTLLTSLLSAIIGAMIAGWYNLKVESREYVNKYHEMIIARRISAYEHVESMIAVLKTAVLDDDNRPYHLLFAGTDGLRDAHLLHIAVRDGALWLSDEAFIQTRDFADLLFRATPDGDVIEFAKQNYERIARLRSALERTVARDMLQLHDVESFLKGKLAKPEQEFRPFPPADAPQV